jgi:hypothetical protein
MDTAAFWIAVTSLLISGVSAYVSYRSWRADRPRLHVTGRMRPLVNRSGIEIRAEIEVYNGGRRPTSVRSVGFEAPDGTKLFADGVGAPHRLEESSFYSATIPMGRVLSQPDRRLAPFAIDGSRRKHLGRRWDWGKLDSLGPAVAWEDVGQWLSRGPTGPGE